MDSKRKPLKQTAVDEFKKQHDREKAEALAGIEASAPTSHPDECKWVE